MLDAQISSSARRSPDCGISFVVKVEAIAAELEKGTDMMELPLKKGDDDFYEIIGRAMKAAERRQKLSGDRAKSIRSGTFLKNTPDEPSVDDGWKIEVE